MRTLYHLALSPYSRKVRLALAEKKLPFDLKAEKIWERRHEFLALNPAGKVPTLVDEDGTVVPDSYAICEYLEERYPEPSLLGATITQRAETRRLVAWFDDKFFKEVSRNLVGEKALKKFLGLGEPNSDAIRAGDGPKCLYVRQGPRKGQRENASEGERKKKRPQHHEEAGESLEAV